MTAQADRTIEFANPHDEMAARNKRGLGFLLAGLNYWLLMAVAGLCFPQPVAGATLLVGTAMIVPTARLFSRLVGVQPVSRANPLEEVGRRLLTPLWMFWPVYLVIYFKLPGYLPQTMSLLMATPFCVLGYLYHSKAYYLLAVLRTALCTYFMVWPVHSFVAVPGLTAATYALALVLVTVSRGIMFKVLMLR
jgi:hypothetical protein